MLDMMRRYSESFLIYLIFGAIIVVFAFSFGPGSGSCRSSADMVGWAAMVDDEPIPAQVYAQRYTALMEYQRRRLQGLGGDATAELLERMGLKQQVIDDLIEQKLVAQEARRWGLKVSDQGFLDYLRQRYPVIDQLENRRAYENWVAGNFQTTVQRFESEVRDEMLTQQLAQVLSQNISVSKDELQAEFVREHDRAMITYVKLDPASVPVAAPPAGAVAKLLADEAAAVEALYNNEVLKWRTPRQLRVKQILRRLGAEASDAEVAKARGVLLEVKTQLEGGADFAALAKQYSEDEATKDTGGDLGLRTREQLPTELAEAVAGLKAGALTAEPVRTPAGLALVQLAEAVEPERRKFDEVKLEVAEALWREQQAAKEARAAAEKLLAALQAGKTLEELTVSEEQARTAKDNRLPVRVESAWILKSQESLPRIGAAPELQAEIFTLTAEAPLSPKVHELNGAFYIVRLKEREVPDLAKFEADLDNHRRTAISVKQGRVFRAWVQHLRDRAKIELNPQIFPPAGAEAG